MTFQLMLAIGGGAHALISLFGYVSFIATASEDNGDGAVRIMKSLHGMAGVFFLISLLIFGIVTLIQWAAS